LTGVVSAQIRKMLKTGLDFYCRHRSMVLDEEKSSRFASVVPFAFQANHAVRFSESIYF